jgi:hypothetical protein
VTFQLSDTDVQAGDGPHCPDENWIVEAGDGRGIYVFPRFSFKFAAAQTSQRKRISRDSDKYVNQIG